MECLDLEHILTGGADLKCCMSKGKIFVDNI